MLILNDSRAEFTFPKTPCIAGPRVNPPTSDANFVKFADVLFIKADKVWFNCSFLFTAASVAPVLVFNALL